MCYYNPPCKYQRVDGECGLQHPYHVPNDAECAIEYDDVDTLTLDIIDYIEDIEDDIS